MKNPQTSAPKKLQLLIAIVIIFLFLPLIYWGNKYRPAPKPQACQEIVRAFSPDGKTNLYLPEGWTAFGGNGGVVLAKKACR